MPTNSLEQIQLCCGDLRFLKSMYKFHAEKKYFVQTETSLLPYQSLTARHKLEVVIGQLLCYWYRCISMADLWLVQKRVSARRHLMMMIRLWLRVPDGKMSLLTLPVFLTDMPRGVCSVTSSISDVLLNTKLFCCYLYSTWRQSNPFGFVYTWWTSGQSRTGWWVWAGETKWKKRHKQFLRCYELFAWNEHIQGRSRPSGRPRFHIRNHLTGYTLKYVGLI